MRYRHGLAFAATLGIAVLLAACEDQMATPTPSATLSSGEQGQRLFAVKGCSGCHGVGAEGTDIAPGLPGHSAEQVLRQVRSPLGTMPAFGAERISDQELDLIAAYVESLEGSDSHTEPTLGDAVAIHPWMTLTALAGGRVDEAAHHVRHAIELIEDAGHRGRMEAALGSLNSGQLHDAEHEIEGMLAGVAEPDLSRGELHLQLALGAAQAGDGPEAGHHLEHFIAETGGTESEGASEALERIEAGEEEEARHAIVELIEAAEHQHHRHE